MTREVQISAFIDATTKERLEQHVRATGVKKGHLIEHALLHYLEALAELPADVIVKPRLVLTPESGEVVRKSLGRRRPTKALRDLMRHGD
jgi:hypothetical protein